MKRKKIAILGALITIVSMVILLLPLNALFATYWGSLEVDASACAEEGGTAPVTINMSGYTGNIKWRLDVDGSEVWRTPIYTYQGTSPQVVNVNLGVGSHTATFYMANTFVSAPDNWNWWVADTEPINVEQCSVEEECEGDVSVETSCEYAKITVNVSGSNEGTDWTFELKNQDTDTVIGTDSGTTDANPWSKVVWDGALAPGNYRTTFFADCIGIDKGQEFEIVACEEPGPESGAITVVKRDPGGTLLAGAGFTVSYLSSGNPAAPEGFTDGSGMITFSGLPFDTYKISETTAPAGFGLAPDQIVTLGVDSVAVSVNYVDSPTTTTVTTTTTPTIEVLGITEELPFTGQSMWLYIIGAIMLALAGGLTFVLRAIKSKA
ncbi:MAG: prealbumin-like fold domain-containing protein [Actinomycetota bacterium]